VAWRDSTKEIITANEDGNVTIWSAKDGHPMYVLAAHPSSPITQILWLEDKQQLITCAKDKKVKIYDP
jgi:WD40 repeat protein